MNKYMETYRAYIRKNPLMGGLIVAVLYFLLSRLCSVFMGLLPDGIAFDIVDELMHIVWPVALVWVSGYMSIFRRPGMGRTVRAGLFFFILYGIFLIADIAMAVTMPEHPLKPAAGIVCSIIALIGIGIREEVIFRGIVVNLFAEKHLTEGKYGVLYVAFVSSAFFGALHMVNVLNGVNFFSALIQSVVATFVGASFCAIYLRGGSIWGVALLHTMIDAVGLFEGFFYEGQTSLHVIDSLSLTNFFPILLTLPVIFFLLRKSKRQAIIDRYRVHAEKE